MPSTLNTLNGMTTEDAARILRERYLAHEIDATLYASLTEDIARIESRRSR